ncbi:hypothetical protein FQA39_LY10963 [Lamprigera yunnana]|nr:hypothetical protein FQA39_LY10963 [Lamprigera yunnana]
MHYVAQADTSTDDFQNQSVQSREETTQPVPSTLKEQPIPMDGEKLSPLPSTKEKKRRNFRKAQSMIYINTPEYENRQRIEEERNLVKTDKKRIISTSSEYSVEIELDDSSEEDGFLEEMKQIGEEDTINVEIYYVGKIISFHGEDYEVKFLQRKEQSNCFLFPHLDDISTIEKKDVAAILPFQSLKELQEHQAVTSLM